MKSAKFCAILFLVLFVSIFSSAAPVSLIEARQAAEGWLRFGTERLGTDLGSGSISSIESYSATDENTLFYAVQLSPEGFLIISGDDLLEPVMAFSSKGKYINSDENPLKDMLFQDLTLRLQDASSNEKTSSASPKYQTIRNTWKELLQASSDYTESGLASVTDVRVSPLVKTLWSQDTVKGASKACYNYYTPTSTTQWIEGDPMNYPCGCVATAMAQTMKYFQYPTKKPIGGPYGCWVDNSPTTQSIIGGTASEGGYNWVNMPLSPDSTATDAQCKEIGALCHDAGITVQMAYTASGSGSNTTEAANALKNAFLYSNAIAGYKGGSELVGNGLNEMVNTNLDTLRPVILGITGAAGGHAVVCDGYGYDKNILYHHLNMGWAGSENAWYNLPKIDTSIPFNTVYKCVYNIFTSGKGEIVSGRVATAGGSGVAGYKMTAQSATKTLTAYSNSNGIFSFEKLDSNTTYTITCSDKETVPQEVTTGKSEDNKSVGNVWGVNFLVGGGPVIALSTNELNPECAVGENAPADVFYVWNSGVDKINFSITDDVTWLACSPTSGSSTSAGDKKPITVTYSTSGLAKGTYTGTITVSDPNVANSPQTITVTLTVVGASISVSPAELTAYASQGTSPEPQSFQAWNAGPGILNFKVTVDSAWLSCSPTTGTSTGTSDKKTIQVIYNTASMAKGEYYAVITVADSAEGGAHKDIDVTLTIGPKIQFYPLSISASCAYGADAPDGFFDIWNAGGDTLRFSITDNVGWLSCTPASGTSTGPGDRKRIQIEYNTAGLAPGGYSAIITVADSNALNSPQTIPVVLSVIIKPKIKLSVSELNSTCVLGENADPDQFTVCNEGEKSILYYTISTNASWLACSPSSGNSSGVEDVKTIDVTYSTSTLSIGTYSAVITVSDPNAVESPKTIDVSVEVGPDGNDIPQNDELKVTLLSNSGGITRDFSNRVSFWPDFSSGGNNARQDKTSKQPFIGNVFEGAPTISFDGKKLLEINSSNTINAGGPYTMKTMEAFFKTGDDIVTRQVIFSIGDSKKGLNSYIDNGNIYLNAWNLTDDDKTGPFTAWGPIFLSTPIVANTPYSLCYLFDQPNRQIEGLLNGTSIGTAGGVQELYGTKSKSGIGGGPVPTLFHDGKKGSMGFKGKIGAFINYNTILTGAEIVALENYLNNAFKNSFADINDYALWLTPDAGLEKTTANHAISWLDRSSNFINFSQRSAKAQPVCYENLVNTQTGLLFNGVQSWMGCKSNKALNSSKTPYAEKTIFAVLQTGTNISDRQALYAEGDKNAGLNIYLDNGQIYMCAWNLKAKDGSSVWGPIFVSGPVAVNTLYCVELVFDQVVGLEGFINGVSIGAAAGSGLMAKHSPATLGTVRGKTCFHDGPGKSGYFYSGYVFELIMYNSTLGAIDTATMENYFNTKYGIVFN